MAIYIDGRRLKQSVKSRIRISNLIKQLEFTRETVIVKVNGTIVTEFDFAGPKDRVEFIRVSTGG